MYEINKAAVIGAGTMGRGIAGQLANAGIEVLLLDLPADGDNRNAISERAMRRLLDPNQPGLLLEDFAQRIEVGNIEDDLHKLADCDWIVEAIVERLDLKRDLYARLEQTISDDWIVTSNTSTIPSRLLVEGRSRAFRERFAITHYFNPHQWNYRPNALYDSLWKVCVVAIILEAQIDNLYKAAAVLGTLGAGLAREGISVTTITSLFFSVSK